MSRVFAGYLVKEARAVLGLERDELALRIGKSKFTVQSIELGRQVPSVPVLADIADVIGCPIDAFFVEGRRLRGRSDYIATEHGDIIAPAVSIDE